VENLDIILSDTLDLPLLILSQVLGAVLIDGVVKEQDFVSMFGVLLENG